jgi:hypothetical protein
VSDEVIVRLPAPRERIALAREVRSTLICAALRALDSRGLTAAYYDALDPRVAPSILSLTAGLWVPVELAVAHYAACDRLGLDPAVIEEIGSDVGKRIQKSVISVLVRLSREAGATPWSVFAHVPRLNELTWRGGAIEVTKHGPKDARLEWVGQPCAAIGYYRTSFCGFVRGVLELFCRRCYVHVISNRCGSTTLSVRIAWV